MPVYLDYPPEPTGDAEKDIRALYVYLYQLCETLNVFMNNVKEDK